MKIFLRPGDVLVAFLPGSAVATGRFATGRAHELATFNWANLYFSCRIVEGKSQEERNRTQPAQNTSHHALDAIRNRDGKPFQNLAAPQIDSGR